MEDSNRKRVIRQIQKKGRTAVQPFKLEDYKAMLNICKNNMINNDPKIAYQWHRNYILLILGCNIGARIETLLNLIVDDFQGDNIMFTESKTQKKFKADLNSKVVKELEIFLEKWDKQRYDFIFTGKKNKGKPITPQHTARIIKQLAKQLNIKYKVANHSMRKSWGRWAYEANNNDLALVQEMYGHSSPIITMFYICVNQKTVEKAKKSSSWGL